MAMSTVNSGDVTIMCLADNLRQIRSNSGLTQKELASRVGVEHSRISEIENGRGNPTISTLVAIASALGTSVAKLVRENRKS